MVFGYFLRIHSANAFGADMVEMKPSEAQRRFWETLDLPLSADEKAMMLLELQREGAQADRRYEGGHL